MTVDRGAALVVQLQAGKAGEERGVLEAGEGDTSVQSVGVKLSSLR